MYIFLFIFSLLDIYFSIQIALSLRQFGCALFALRHIRWSTASLELRRLSLSLRRTPLIPRMKLTVHWWLFLAVQRRVLVLQLGLQMTSTCSLIGMEYLSSGLKGAILSAMYEENQI